MHYYGMVLSFQKRRFYRHVRRDVMCVVCDLGCVNEGGGVGLSIHITGLFHMTSSKSGGGNTT